MDVPFASLRRKWCGSAGAGTTAPPKPARNSPAVTRPMTSLPFMDARHPVGGQRESCSAPAGTLAPGSGGLRCRGLLWKFARRRLEEGGDVPRVIDATGLGLDPRTHSSRET